MINREKQILRTCLPHHLEAALARVFEHVRFAARVHVDDVDRHLGGFREADDTIRRLALEDRVAGDPVIERVGLAVGDEAICIVKATNVIVEVPAGREPRDNVARTE